MDEEDGVRDERKREKKKRGEKGEEEQGRKKREREGERERERERERDGKGEGPKEGERRPGERMWREIYPKTPGNRNPQAIWIALVLKHPVSICRSSHW